MSKSFSRAAWLFWLSRHNPNSCSRKCSPCSLVPFVHENQQPGSTGPSNNAEHKVKTHRAEPSASPPAKAPATMTLPTRMTSGQLVWCDSSSSMSACRSWAANRFI